MMLWCWFMNEPFLPSSFSLSPSFCLHERPQGRRAPPFIHLKLPTSMFPKPSKLRLKSQARLELQENQEVAGKVGKRSFFLARLFSHEPTLLSISKPMTKQRFQVLPSFIALTSNKEPLTAHSIVVYPIINLNNTMSDFGGKYIVYER